MDGLYLFYDKSVFSYQDIASLDTMIEKAAFQQKPIYMDLEKPMVDKMLKAYRQETGDEETPAIVQAGGTYAKMVDNILCFGGVFPGEEDTMHQADEKLSIESLMKMARIYARALYSLCCE